MQTPSKTLIDLDGQSVTQQMADTSTWVRKRGQWQCVMHTETPLDNGAS